MNILDQFNHGEAPKPVRTLLYDIENSSIQVETWRTWQADAIRVTREWYILSISWKWLDEKKIHVLTLADFPKTFKKDYRDDSALLKAFYPVFDEADIVIGHNSNKHDNRKLAARFVFHGMNPPSPYQQLDTCVLAKRRFSFTSNRLDDLGKYLGVGKKQHCPPSVWNDCMQGDEKAFKKMARYNKHDVKLLEDVYKKLRAWLPTHPYIGVSGPNRKRFSEIEGLICPRCGSSRLSSKGWRETQASYYRQYECIDCGGFCQSQQRVSKKVKGLKSI
jgi:Zn ribbon nucleic-acid-binding protein